MHDALLIFGGLAIVAILAIVANVMSTRNARHHSDSGLAKRGDGSREQGAGGGGDSI
ncbi:hypothetical protein [uncultured Roseobacter sp.]|uniref:hypothetical protein n=1 Tax=uncultured Roseobacter sp. TaxID=114847 RepID=UPI0026026E29|nr:hypothetical protein [uncultured Roseobacter sp.]